MAERHHAYGSRSLVALSNLPWGEISGEILREADPIF
jgi:hypothetical protein